jgi:hypothetical protein
MIVSRQVDGQGAGNHKSTNYFRGCHVRPYYLSIADGGRNPHLSKYGNLACRTPSRWHRTISKGPGFIREVSLDIETPDGSNSDGRGFGIEPSMN